MRNWYAEILCDQQMRRVLFILGVLSVFACSSELDERKTFEAYAGPIMEVDTVTILYSDSAVVRVKIIAPKQFEFENGDREFPHHIFIEFYEPDGSMSSTLEANSAYYTKETNLYKANGDVEVIGYLEPQKMNSEELYWDPNKEEIYTDTFVRIQTDDQISTGTGMVAKQDFSTYRILNPSGTIYLEEDEQADTLKRNSQPSAQNSPTEAKKTTENKVPTQDKNQVVPAKKIVNSVNE